MESTFIKLCVFSLSSLSLVIGCGGSNQEQSPAAPSPTSYGYNSGGGASGGVYGNAGATGYPSSGGGYGYNGQNPAHDPNASWNNAGAPQTGQAGQAGQAGSGSAGAPSYPGYPGQGAPATAPQVSAPDQRGQAAPSSASGITGTAQIVDPTMASAASATLARQSGGGTPEGPVVAGNFQTGQTLEYNFTYQPGKDYVLVASSIGPASKVDAQIIFTPLPGMFSIPSQSGKGKPTATGSQVIVKSGKFAFIQIAMPAKYVLTLSKGAGLVAAQLYSK